MTLHYGAGFYSARFSRRTVLYFLWITSLGECEMAKLSMILAMTPDGCIGNNNQLPWHGSRLAADMMWFRLHTLGKVVVMGRKTFESIGKPLPKRTNVVITSHIDHAFPDGVIALNPLDPDAFAEVVKENNGDVVFIGGKMVYEKYQDIVEVIYRTIVHADLAGDTYVDGMRWDAWKVASEAVVKVDTNNSIMLTLQTLVRV